MTTKTLSADDLLQQLGELQPLIQAHARWSEENCRMHPEVFAALSSAGLFSIWKPAQLGGLELEPVAALAVFEAAARIEPAVGWAIANQTGIDAIPCSLLPVEAAAEVLADPARPVAGAWFPPGRADVVRDGYRVSGRWAFASMCHYASHMMGMGIIHEGGQPRLAADGSPAMIMAFFDAADATIVDNWDTLGMRGTGSHDISVDDLFVPEGNVWHLAPIVHRREGACAGPLYGLFPWLQIASLGPVGVGIGQAAVDALVEVATAKTSSYLSTPLREKEVAQANVARAHAMVGSARAYLHASVVRLWEIAQSGARPSLTEGLEVQLAVTNALETGARVVNLVHDTVGTTAIRNSERIPHLYRDGRTISQHTFGGLGRYESCGKVMFGLQSDWGFFYL
jgi:alkylation response protein AidB-like acyl-CoA dehydrogenase